MRPVVRSSSIARAVASAHSGGVMMRESRPSRSNSSRV